MTEGCLAGVQTVFWKEGPRVSQRSLAPGQKRFAPVQPMLRQCNQPFAPVSAKTFCALSKALWGRSADLTSVPGGLVCKGWGWSSIY